jgi:hypothetical protein
MLVLVGFFRKLYLDSIQRGCGSGSGWYPKLLAGSGSEEIISDLDPGGSISEMNLK